MSDAPERDKNEPLHLTPEEARLIIKAIEEVEKEEAADLDRVRQPEKGSEHTSEL